jgi:hypothetical protein
VSDIAFGGAAIDSSNLAAWVQAVGSVIAIFVAIAVPAVLHILQRKQQRLDRERDRQLRLHEDKMRARSLALGIYQPVTDIGVSLEMLLNQYGGELTQAPEEDLDLALRTPGPLDAIATQSHDLGSAASAIQVMLHKLDSARTKFTNIKLMRQYGAPPSNEDCQHFLNEVQQASNAAFEARKAVREMFASANQVAGS